MKKLFMVLFALLIVGSSQSIAQAKFGLGWYSMSAPVGGRLWFNDKVGIDLGLGFANDKLVGGDDSRFHINAGVVFNAIKAGEVNFFIRPGVEYQTNAITVDGELSGKLIVTADLGAEWFVTDQFSLSVGHGLQFEQLSSPEDSAEWGISALRALSFSNVGFHFYFN